MRNQIIFAFSTVFLLIATAQAHAEISLSPLTTECDMFAVQGHKERQITVIFPVDPAQAAEFGNKKSIQSFLNKIAPTAIALCRTQPNPMGDNLPPISPTHVKAMVGDLFAPVRFEARMTLADGQVEVLRNDLYSSYILQKQAEAKAQMQQKLASEKADAARRARIRVRGEFTAKNGVEAWADARALQANPFPFKDKITGIRADFQQMISADEAIFGNILVGGVDSTQFTITERPSVLAIKVQGLRPLKTPAGEMNLPYGKFVGAYFVLTRIAQISSIISSALITRLPVDLGAMTKAA